MLGEGAVSFVFNPFTFFQMILEYGMLEALMKMMDYLSRLESTIESLAKAKAMTRPVVKTVVVESAPKVPPPEVPKPIPVSAIPPEEWAGGVNPYLPVRKLIPKPVFARKLFHRLGGVSL